MKNINMKRTASALLCGAFVLAAGSGWAAPKSQDLYAKLVYINPTTGITASTSGAGLIPMWGFATTPDGLAQVPGPKIDVAADEADEGLLITVHNLLTNLPTADPVSLVIPGLYGTTDVGNPVKFPAGDADYPDRVRSLVPEVPVGESRVYAWTGPLKLGTYAYHSGTHVALQVQMGLYGMVTVRGNSDQVYPGYTVPANLETPVIFSEVDPLLHWAVHTNGYGPDKTISSTIHSDPSLFLINGRAYSQATPPPDLAPGQRSQPTLFRMINFCWDSRIPTLVGPVPSGNLLFPGSGGNYLSVIAEDGNLYPYARTAYAPNLGAMKTMDALFTPPNPPGLAVDLTYMLFDRRLGLSNPSGAAADAGMYARWEVTPASVAPILAVSPGSLNFAATAGGANPASQVLNIANTGGGTLNWTAIVTAGAPWLSATPGSGSGNGSVTVSANIAGLVPGPYSGTIQVAAAGAGSSPQTISVSLVVSAGSILAVSPPSLTFAATAGGANPANQALNLSNPGLGTLNWTATVSLGAPWLSATPGSGTGNGSVTVSANIAGLLAGTYNGTIVVSDPFASGSPQAVNVSLVVKDPVGIQFFNTRTVVLGPTTHPLTGVPAGALLVLTTQAGPGINPPADAIVSSTPALAWTKRVDAAVSATSGAAEIWTAVSPGGNITVNSSWNLARQSSVCYVVTNSESVLEGNSAFATAQADPLVNVTTTRAKSIIFCVSSDRTGTDGVTRAYRDAATQTYYSRQTGAGATTGYHYYKLAPTIATYTEGLTLTPTTVRAGTCALEIRSQ